MKKISFQTSALLLLICMYGSCTKPSDQSTSSSETDEASQSSLSTAALQCTAQAEQIDYSIYRMCSDGTRIGDVAPYYDSAAGNFKIYFLKDVWNAMERHPLYGFTTSNFYSYTQTPVIVSSSAASQCAQDNSVGAASIVKSGSTYYMFYTGHNPDMTGCTDSVKREGVMLATSTNPASTFTKKTTFTTIVAPTGIGYDETDNWRDPFVTWDPVNHKWLMILAARKNVSGIWKGVIAKYTSTNLLNWTYGGVFYDGGTANYFNMECPHLFKLGNYYYLFFSDQSLNDDAHKYVHYRKSTSLNGPWSLPTGVDRIDGNAFYAGSAVTDAAGDSYMFGWCHVLSGDTDAGSWAWGGNLITHKIYALSNGDIAQSIPHTVKNWLETNTEAIVKNSQWGNVTNTMAGKESYRLVSNADSDIANVIYNPVNTAQYMITTTVSYSSSSRDFGFMIGACDGYNDMYQLRFVPSQSKFKFERKNRNALDNNPDNEIPITLSPNTNYKVQIVIENSVVVVYINDQIAFTNRIYKASNTNWGVFTDHSDVTFSNIIVNHP